MMKIFVAFAVVLLGFTGLAYSAVDGSPASLPAAKAVVAEPAPLVLFSRQVFAFRAPNQGISPVDRAKRARTRINEQLAQAGAHVVSLKPDATGVQVHIDGAASFYITPEDLDPGSNDSLQQSAEQAAAALTLAIRESVESRSLDSLVRALGVALAATVFYALGLWGVARARRAATRRLVAISQQHSSKLHVGGLSLIQADRIASSVQLVIAVLYHLLVLVLTVEWLSFVLKSFPYTRAWGESLNSFLLNLATPLFASAMGAVPELLTAALIFYMGYLTTKALDRLFANVQSGNARLSWLDADIAAPTQRIAKVVVWLFSLAMAYPYLPGSDTEAFKGLSVLVGLMLSMGASSLVGQAASGLILTYGRAFRKGEYVRVAEHEGTVTEMGIFTTRIRTGMGEELTVSNASILSSTTKNYSRAVKGSGYVLDTSITIGYDTPWRQVHALLQEAAQRTPGVLSDPKPQVFQTALSDWYPVYRLVVQAKPEGPMPRAIVLSNLHANIQDVFNEYGVQIMSPNYIADPQQAKMVPPGGRYPAPAANPAAPDKA
jgi:small-conductance mechanosensitive channel